MKKCVLIVNPKSGKNLEHDFLYKYQEILFQYEYETIVYFTSKEKHATEIIENLKDIDLVISLGGDGTFNEVVSGNLKRKERLLLTHIPLGTTNDVGTMFGYGKDPVENLKLALDGEIENIDICTINNKPFVYVAGFGKFMNVPYETPRDLKSRYGHLAYIFEGAKSFSIPTKLYDITYSIDGKEYSGEYSFMLISNANRIAGINNFYRNVKLNDNKFEVILCNLTKKSDIVKSLYYFATSNIKSAKGFEFHKLSELEVKFKEPPVNAWCIDGEKLEDVTTTYKISIVNNFTILMPRKNIKKLFVEE
ncbi:MAG TPA: diacylglycerol kinase family lipid kinase [Bacilli bacterium]|nr:diacylglycerol kinase family lipid kinase [Bacilli bacterium]